LLHISNTDMLKSMYFAYFHSLMKYGVLFWGNSSDSKKVFTLQKKTVRIMVGVKSQNYLRDYRYYLFHVNIYFHYWTSL
jgi:hypothetical protein